MSISAADSREPYPTASGGGRGSDGRGERRRTLHAYHQFYMSAPAILFPAGTAVGRQTDVDAILSVPDLTVAMAATAKDLKSTTSTSCH